VSEVGGESLFLRIESASFLSQWAYTFSMYTFMHVLNKRQGGKKNNNAELLGVGEKGEEGKLNKVVVCISKEPMPFVCQLPVVAACALHMCFLFGPRIVPKEGLRPRPQTHFCQNFVPLV
jgi:hypothetical protein